MNWTEQRARHLAVASAEARIDQLEEVTFGLAETIVKDREGYANALAKSHAEIRALVERRATEQSDELARFRRMTFWQRLCWLFSPENG